MEENCTQPVPNPQNSTTSHPKQRGRHVFRWAAGTVGFALLTVIGYSIYVAVHEPDPQETIVLGQTKLAAGSPAGLRILVRNRVSFTPVKGAEVSLSLRGRLAEINLGTFRTDDSGTLTGSVAIPDIAPGEYELVIASRSRLGSDHVIKKVEIVHSARILISSDKPIYQPGQTIHLRTLALNARTQKPLANQAILFEIKDPKGNKVFKETCKSSAFGIASTDFVLATELNLGRYEISAAAGPATTERTVEVKRYVLPKFKIQVTSDRSYYLPGQTVSGSVDAGYFFGRPVSAGAVKLTAATFEEKPVVIATLTGHTDKQGKFPFQFALPDFFVGLPQKNEQAFLDLKAGVTDTAGHTEEQTLSLSVARQELEVTVIPEAGQLVPGVENIVYVLAAYPDGRPATAKVFANGNAFPTDAQGVAEVKMAPADVLRPLDLQVIDAAGRRARATYRPDTNTPSPAFLLRTDKAVYQAGQTAQVSILSPEAQNTVFLDLIREGQTVLTKSVPLKDHRAGCALALPASLVGTLKLNAYVITAMGEDRGCTRLLYVNPATGLNVAAKLSKPLYRPGEIAKVDFAVTDAEGHPAPAALGIAAVDESVFALAENRPGLLRQFLDAEADLLKPRYEIKSFAWPGELFRGAAGNQALALAYLASFEEPRTGPTIEDLVQEGYISPRLVEHARDLRGTPAFERLRRDPQYAQAMRLLEGGGTTYSLREATGPVKQESVAGHRRLYFSRVWSGAKIAVCALLFLLPLFLLYYYSRPTQALAEANRAGNQPDKVVALAQASCNVLAALTLLPFLFYPFGFLLLDLLGLEPDVLPTCILLGLEAALVLAAAIRQLASLLKLERKTGDPITGAVASFVAMFLAQFVISRAAFISLVLSSPHEEDFAILLVLGSVFAPLILLGGLGSFLRRKLTALGNGAKLGSLTVVEVLVIISIFFILAAMLLPALGKAKARAQRITLANDLKQLEVAGKMADLDRPPSPASTPAQPRVRRDFPETLFWRPELITDDRGIASLEIPLADSITTWRASIDGVSAAGRLGSTEVPIPVFQDFFVDLDLPVSMSLGDEVSVPLTCYNYLKEAQDIRLTVARAGWFETRATNLDLHLGPNEVKSVSLPLKVVRVGNHGLRVSARGARLADAVEREVRVVPTGERIDFTRTAVLRENWTDTFGLPPDIIPDSQSLGLKFYPSRFSEVVEGLESIFQAPYGCFEQTSSTTYPNILVLDYLKRMGKLTPEIEIKARKFVNAGYQRLLTFEVPGGGFEWFGHSPAHVGLTAYGILEFTDMSRVHPVDQGLIARTTAWLYSQQNSDGAWDSGSGLHGWSGRAPATAYVAWALAEAGDRSAGLAKALHYLRRHPEQVATAYQKALAANACLAWDADDSFGRELAQQIRGTAVRSDKMVHWTSRGQSLTYSYGRGLDIQTTALSALALMKAGLAPETVKEALTWISRQKEPDGTWGSTQDTILAMRALLAGSSAPLGQEFDSTIAVLLNGKSVETFHVNKANSDVMKQLDITGYLQPGENHIELRQAPAGELAFQVTGGYWLPSGGRPVDPAASPVPLKALQISLQYDRTSLPVNAQLKCAVTVRNNTGQPIAMAIVDLGIPPGFEVDPAAFQHMQESGQIAKFEVTGNQVILYLRAISNQEPFQFNYSLRAKYPLRVQTPPSTVYEYYQPTNRARTMPVTLNVAGSSGS